MTKIIKNIAKIHNFLCIFLLLFIACREDVKVKEYYYKVYYEIDLNETDSVFYSYHAIKITDKNNIREQITYRYSDHRKQITNKSIEYYKLTKNSLTQLNNINDNKGKLVLSTKHVDSCVLYSYGNELHDRIAAITHCFLGEKKIKSVEGKYVESYEFYKMYGLEMGLVYRVFYDKSFIPIKTVREEGYAPIDSIIRTNVIPSEFKLLLNIDNN